MTKAPAIRGIVETCINVSGMNRARHFYEALFEFEVMEHDDRFCAFRVGPDVLLLFTQGASDHPMPVKGGTIPPTLGAGHFAFVISKSELENWQRCLPTKESKSRPRLVTGEGNSIYFRDPDRNLLELVIPGVWANY